MIRALVESQPSLTSHRTFLSMLLQNCGASELTAVGASLPALAHPVAAPGRVPLSTARNILLRRLKASGAIGADALVAFPDDDSWYPPGFLAQVAALFTRDPQLDFWFCRYGSQPSQSRFAETEPVVARTSEIVRNASSNTIFLRGRVVNSIGEFDEALGVGTPAGGAEDLDYALRARRAARKTAYWDGALVGHRDKNTELLARYYASGLFVLARHARSGASSEFRRKIAVGVYYVLRWKLGPIDLGRALRKALAERRRAKSQGSFGSSC
jgi:GT2 family glycosyltransferase